MKIHRRRFLCAASAAALWARQPDPVPPYTIQRVAPGIWFALASPCAVFNCNAAIFEQARGLVVVDSNNMPSLAEALLAHVGRELPAKPVHTLVYSHYHFDHVQGTAAFRKRWPGLRIVSTEATKSLLLERGEQWIQSTVTNAEKIAASTSDPTARQQALTYASEMKGARPVLPDTTFTTEFSLPDSIQPLELRFAGRGHTAGDLLVLSPNRKIVAAGDFAQKADSPFCSTPTRASGFPHSANGPASSSCAPSAATAPPSTNAPLPAAPTTSKNCFNTSSTPDPPARRSMPWSPNSRRTR